MIHKQARQESNMQSTTENTNEALLKLLSVAA